MACSLAWRPRVASLAQLPPRHRRKALEISAAEIAGNHIGDAPVLLDILSQIPEEQDIVSITAEGAYDTRKCHDAFADRGADAVIPPGKNANHRKTATEGAMAKTKLCARRNTLAEPCGDGGADTINETASRYEKDQETI